MSAAAPLSLAAFAATLGELDPPSHLGMTEEHLTRWALLTQIAPLQSVGSPADAAIALSLTANAIVSVIAFDLTEVERMNRLQRALRTLARVSGWLDRDMGVQGLPSAWPCWASPEAGP